MQSTIATYLLLLAATSPAIAGETRCTFQSRQTCGSHGCSTGDAASSFVVLRLEEGQYGRCDGKQPCDWYPLRVQQSGNFLNLDFATGVQGAKMSLDGSMFIETVSIADAVLVSFGRCQP